MTDEEKIQLQTLLDVRQLGKELTKLKIDTEKFKPYRKLYEVVKPFGKFSNNNINIIDRRKRIHGREDKEK